MVIDRKSMAELAQKSREEGLAKFITYAEEKIVSNARAGYHGAVVTFKNFNYFIDPCQVVRALQLQGFKVVLNESSQSIEIWWENRP